MMGANIGLSIARDTEWVVKTIGAGEGMRNISQDAPALLLQYLFEIRCEVSRCNAELSRDSLYLYSIFPKI